MPNRDVRRRLRTSPKHTTAHARNANSSSSVKPGSERFHSVHSGAGTSSPYVPRLPIWWWWGYRHPGRTARSWPSRLPIGLVPPFAGPWTPSPTGSNTASPSRSSRLPSWADAPLDEAVGASHVLRPRRRLRAGPWSVTARGTPRDPAFRRGRPSNASIRGFVILPPEHRHAGDVPAKEIAETHEMRGTRAT